MNQRLESPVEKSGLDKSPQSGEDETEFESFVNPIIVFGFSQFDQSNQAIMKRIIIIPFRPDQPAP
uniref:Uncharacterized protein n=1 Tax=Pithovirus LCPAC201 TaxID=2506591 RepID=A0A481Z5A1_9VIRU|nr:MAG: hypothetical protein LCPAC201_00060 [Pithovirus LCPAC201]